MAYTTISEVRRVSGVDSTLVSDADITSEITLTEKRLDRYLNTTFQPLTVQEIYDGTGTSKLILNKGHIVKIRNLEIDDTAVTIDYIYVYRQSNIIRLSSSAEETVFKTNKPQRVWIEYDYAKMEETSVNTTTTAAASAGSSIVLAVNDETGFTTNDYIAIYGSDKFYEIAKITATSTSQITVDTLSNSHVSGSKIVLMQVPDTIKDLTNILASLRLVARVVGASFDEITGYTLGDMAIQKGEPYTQWRETSERLIKERDLLLTHVRIQPSIG